jgi:hypothetical protein
MSTVSYYIPPTGAWRMPEPVRDSNPMIPRREELQAAAEGVAEQTTAFGKFRSAYKLQADLFSMHAERYKTPYDHYFEFKVNSTAYGEHLSRTAAHKL